MSFVALAALVLGGCTTSGPLGLSRTLLNEIQSARAGASDRSQPLIVAGRIRTLRLDPAADDRGPVISVKDNLPSAPYRTAFVSPAGDHLSLDRVVLSPNERFLAVLARSRSNNAVGLVVVVPLTPESIGDDAVVVPTEGSVHDVAWFPDSETLAVTVLLAEDRMKLQAISPAGESSARTLASSDPGESFILHSSVDPGCPFMLTRRSPAGGKIVRYHNDKAVVITKIQPNGISVASCADGRIAASSCSTQHGCEFVELLADRASRPMRRSLRDLPGTPVAILRSDDRSHLTVVVQDGAAIGTFRFNPDHADAATDPHWCPAPATARHLSTTGALITNFEGSAVLSTNDLASCSIPIGPRRSIEPPCTMERRRVSLSDGNYADVSLCLPDGPLEGLILSVYGNYGITPAFPLRQLYSALLKRGIGLGVAHVRGGGEYGPAGWSAAQGDGKRTSAEDLIAIARSLRPVPIVLRAQSAGGIVAINALAKAPDLFRGVVLVAPVVDPDRSLSDARIMGRVNDRVEWGAVATDMGKCPQLPPILVQYAANDQLVPRETLFDWTARCHQRDDEKGNILLQEVSGGDHAQSMTIGEADRALAGEMSFVAWAVGGASGATSALRYNHDASSTNN